MTTNATLLKILFVRFMLSRDKVISEEELKEIQDFVQFSYGKNLALYHLSF